ncbi:hypothetical protein R4Y45_05990 [Holzapfeliella sp. He02]|uniref:Uncharacterized protein n=1 Tax=Holzapfeliella saturejae TaxID=3082953 RepID=A0ABU8SHE6_9LACO
MDLSLIILVLMLGVIIYLYTSKQRNIRDYQKYYKNTFLKQEKSRGNYETDVQLMMDSENLNKAGYPQDAKGYSILVKEKEGLLHFNYANSPQIELINIDYKPKYQSVNSGSITKLGNNYVNNGTSRKQGVASYGLLTFRNIETDQKFILKCLLNEDIHMKLKSDFIKID